MDRGSHLSPLHMIFLHSVLQPWLQPSSPYPVFLLLSLSSSPPRVLLLSAPIPNVCMTGVLWPLVLSEGGSSCPSDPRFSLYTSTDTDTKYEMTLSPQIGEIHMKWLFSQLCTWRQCFRLESGVCVRREAVQEGSRLQECPIKKEECACVCVCVCVFVCVYKISNHHMKYQQEQMRPEFCSWLMGLLSVLSSTRWSVLLWVVCIE